MAHAFTCGRLCVAGLDGSSKLASTSSSFAGRRVAFQAVRTLQTQGRGTLQVVAGKGKGKKLMRRGMGSQQMNQGPPTPPVDPDNEEFVIFVRSKRLPKWVPLSIIKGGTAANMLVKGLDSELSQSMAGSTLVKNIGEALYKDKPAVERMIRQQFPPLKDVKDFEYGFKIRNKEEPAKWWVSENIKLIPPQEELGGGVVDDVKDFFGQGFSNITKALKGGMGTGPAKSA